jgi:hypothetical protein
MTVDLDALERDAHCLLDMTVGVDTTLALIARIRQLEQSNATKATRIAELLAVMAAAIAWRDQFDDDPPDEGCEDPIESALIDAVDKARAAGNPDYQPAWTRR